MMTAYRLNVRVFWPLLTCGCTALLCLLQALRSKAGAAAAAAWECGSPVPLPTALPVLLLLAYLALRCRGRWPGSRAQEGAAGRGGAGGAAAAGAGRPRSPVGREPRRRVLLESFYEAHLRLSPHVLGHSKAHVSLVVGEVVRAGKAPGRLAFRGDFVQTGSAYEQHKVRSPDAFDVLVPLRLPPRLELRVLPGCPEQTGLRGAYVCALQVASEAQEQSGGGGGLSPPGEALCAQGGDGKALLSAALVARWFQAQVQRCLGAVRSRLQERCRVQLAVGPGRPLALQIAPRSDYVCCHLSMAVHLTPAIPLCEGLYLTPLALAQPPAPAQLGTFWTLNVSKAEQRLLAWVRDQAPADSCHLKCLQVLKGLRELGGRALEPPWAAQWDLVLSSYLLKTALFWVLLRTPWQAWEDQFLVARLEDLVLFLGQSLRRRRLPHLFLGNPGLSEMLSLPRFLKEASQVNLLADYDGPTLDRVATHLLSTWKQAPRIIRMYGDYRYRKKYPL